MDAQTLRKVAILSFSLVLLNCAKTPDAQTVYPKPEGSCVDQAVEGAHLVRWKSGRVTRERGGSREEFIAKFVQSRLDQIDLVEPDYRVSLERPSTSGQARADALSVPSTSVADNWGAERIGASVAWQKNARGQGVTVAVVDSGADVNHPQLKNQLMHNSGEEGVDKNGLDKASNGIDDDGNGLVDDAVGYNFSNESGLLDDQVGHGTHVSGIIAAEHSDSQAGSSDHVQGIAPKAKILPLQFIDGSGGGTLFNAMRAIDYASERGAKIINASWGGSGCSKLLHDQILGLQDKGVIFVAAAGNSDANIDYAPEYPAAYNLVSQITVGAVGLFDSRADFSNYGDQAVHLFAPGVDIVSTIPGGKMAALSGTSMATPIVAGALADLLSLHPSATIAQLRSALYQASVHSSSYRNASQGRLNLASALSALDQGLP